MVRFLSDYRYPSDTEYDNTRSSREMLQFSTWCAMRRHMKTSNYFKKILLQPDTSKTCKFDLYVMDAEVYMLIISGLIRYPSQDRLEIICHFHDHQTTSMVIRYQWHEHPPEPPSKHSSFPGLALTTTIDDIFYCRSCLSHLYILP